MMSNALHLRLFLYSFVTWLTFYIFGLPDYYQSWPFTAKVMLCVFVTVAYFPITSFSLRRFWENGDHLTNSLWLALYLTVPLFLYDYVLLACYRQLGIGFVVPYWYLTLFYFSFWLQFPLIALWMRYREAQR